MTICKKFKSSVRERLKEHKSLYDIGMELCDSVGDPKDKALRVVKDILEEDKVDIGKYLRDNAGWLGYNVSQIRNSENIKVSQQKIPSAPATVKNTNESKEEKKEVKSHFQWKPIVPSSPSKETTIVSKESKDIVKEEVMNKEVEAKSEAIKEKEKQIKDEIEKEKYGDKYVIEFSKLHSLIDKLYDDIDLSKMNLEDVNIIREYNKKIINKINKYNKISISSPDDIHVVSEK
ncbi:MAG: hypothetical protein LAN71_17275 [Acidobacteriia bacterium]|nr:hypothetical protein [Terriglobia bacterium]